MAARVVQDMTIPETTSLDNMPTDGKASSIKEWANSAFRGKEEDSFPDLDQKRAFEIIIAHFVLTHCREECNERFFSEANEGHSFRCHSDRHACITQRQELCELGGIGAKDQLLMFLSGVGGSGKSKVMNAVQKHAKSFCQQLGATCDKRTVVVAAFSCAAATSTDGEKIHSALKLNSQNLRQDHIMEWNNVRMLLIDEVSLANRTNLFDIDRKLRALMDSEMKPFGGINIVFAGDVRQLAPTFVRKVQWINCMVELNN